MAVRVKSGQRRTAVSSSRAARPTTTAHRFYSTGRRSDCQWFAIFNPLIYLGEIAISRHFRACGLYFFGVGRRLGTLQTKGACGASKRLSARHGRSEYLELAADFGETVTTDEQLVERALAGDSDAFGEVVRRWER